MSSSATADSARNAPRAGVVGARVFGADGPPESLLRVDGTPALPDVSVDATGLWLLRGVVDCHTHLAWNAFDEADRIAPAADAALSATLRAGVTSARDAGGLSAADLRAAPGPARACS